MNNIWKLTKSEMYKLIKDHQILFVTLIIIVYLLYSFWILEVPLDQTFAGWCISKTTDSVFMVFLIGIVTATVFTNDYSNRTYKNYLPYVSMRTSFLSKIIADILGTFILLFLWYLVVIINAAFASSSFSFGSLQPLFFRFITQYCLLLFHSCLIIFSGIITRSRVIASVFTILSWLIYSFIPINGEPFFDIVISKYQWGKAPDIILCLFLLLSYLLSCFVSFIIADKQEVLV